ncbi:UvrD-helicase domain-containing protein [Clostridium tunisiense]|uniref:UvrD-helicase domain-containing protein n=1 Tax=Clostridium tunisiense TaxID=219748 RepID=UPI00030C283A|nr:UvrD-helicase domain-containing protein [Clostridium tunisiense]
MASQIEEKVFNCIDKNRSFKIEAGAGSGKTWTLIQSLLYIIKTKGEAFKNNMQQVACITYTNVAKNEISSRIQSSKLVKVSTIHEFLWDIIKPFQHELRIELKNYICEKIELKQKELSSIKNHNTKKYIGLQETVERYVISLKSFEEYKGNINYCDKPKWRKGEISHDELLDIANSIIKKYHNIHKIINDVYPIIFVDEYQDTSPKVKEILLDYLKPNTSILLGFFGDYIQQIYDSSIGRIDGAQYDLELIVKTENYRSSTEVINILNKIRSDITQSQSGIEKHGKCLFYYLNNEDLNTEDFIQNRVKLDLSIGDSNIKKLYLTTKSIAIKNGYVELHDLYEKTDFKNKDQLLKNKDNRDCPFANYLFDIEEIIVLYNEKRIQSMLKKVPRSINNFNDKTKMRESLEQLIIKMEHETIGDVFKFVNDNQIQVMSDKLISYFNKSELQDEFFNEIINLKYSQFRRLYNTVKESSPFSTNHGTKGAEYDNVVCVINDNDWNKYNVNKYLDKSDFETSRYDRTEHLFYVICSRAKYNLAIVFLSILTDEAIKRAKYLFGESNFVDLSNG